MQSAPKLTIASELDEDDFVQRKPYQIQRLVHWIRRAAGFVVAVGRGHCNLKYCACDFL